MNRRKWIGKGVLAVSLSMIMTMGTAGMVAAEDEETVKDVYIDNTEDKSVSYVTGIAVVDEEETTVYEEQTGVTYSTPETSEVVQMLSDAKGALEKYAEDNGLTDLDFYENIQTTGKVWDNRKYTTVEDSDVIGDSDYLQGAVGINDDYTRTHIASGDYGKITYFLIKMRAIKAAEETAAAESASESAAESAEEPAAEPAAAAEPAVAAEPAAAAEEVVAEEAEPAAATTASSVTYAAPVVSEAMATLVDEGDGKTQVAVRSLIISTEELLAQLAGDQETVEAVQAFLEEQKAREDILILEAAAIDPKVFGEAKEAIVRRQYPEVKAGDLVTFLYDDGKTETAAADMDGSVEVTFHQAGAFVAFMEK